MLPKFPCPSTTGYNAARSPARAHQRVIDRLVAMRMELTDDVTDNTGAFLEGRVRADAHLAHRVDDAAMHRFQAVADVRQRARHDRRQGIGEVALLRAPPSGRPEECCRHPHRAEADLSPWVPASGDGPRRQGIRDSACGLTGCDGITPQSYRTGLWRKPVDVFQSPYTLSPTFFGHAAGAADSKRGLRYDLVSFHPNSARGRGALRIRRPSARAGRTRFAEEDQCRVCDRRHQHHRRRGRGRRIERHPPRAEA